MSFVKNTFGFFERKVLRIHTPLNQVIKGLPKQRHAMSTFRTYELGGDPFNDRIGVPLDRWKYGGWIWRPSSGR